MPLLDRRPSFTRRCPCVENSHRRSQCVRSRRRETRRWSRHVIFAILGLLFVGGTMSACGQERPSGAAPLSERAENDIPLNPPTLRFHVSTDGQIAASPDLEAEAGEVVALVLENESGQEYTLRFLDPEGETVFAVDAPADARGDGRAMPRNVGPHIVEVYPADMPGTGEQFAVTVSET